MYRVENEQNQTRALATTAEPNRHALTGENEQQHKTYPDHEASFGGPGNHCKGLMGDRRVLPARWVVSFANRLFQAVCKGLNNSMRYAGTVSGKTQQADQQTPC